MGTRWLSESDQVVWRHYLRATMEVREGLERDLLAENDLSLNEYEVLVVLSEQPNHRIRMATLADELVNSRSRLSHTVGPRRVLPSHGRRVRCAGGRRTPSRRVRAPPHLRSAHAGGRRVSGQSPLEARESERLAACIRPST